MLDRRGWEGRSIDDDVVDLVDAVRDYAAPWSSCEPEGQTTVRRHSLRQGASFIDELGTLNQRRSLQTQWCWWSPDSP